MNKILIFGGTTEGRLLAEYCAEKKISVWISVVSQYGKELLPGSPWIRIHAGAMDQRQISDFLKEKGISLVIDATHPYARAASEQIREACRLCSVRLVRCLRGTETGAEGSVAAQVVSVENTEAAVRVLQSTTGPVLLTTGSRELAAYTALPDFQERLYVRVLPSSGVLLQCEELGIPGKHIIAMQGPFSGELNRALLRQIGAKWMVTKASGSEGGFSEKLTAAADCGVSVVVVERPQEKGLSLSEVESLLSEEISGNEACCIAEAGENCDDEEPSKNKILLAGIGVGTPGLMTGEVIQAILTSDVILGAERMLEAAKRVCLEAVPSATGKQTEKKWFPYYQEDKIMGCIESRLPGEQILVLYSGDTGFYSGAAKLAKEMRRRGLPYEILPGISSISYLASKLSVPWEDAECLTAHGRELSAEAVLASGKKRMFLLVGGENGAGVFFQKLQAAGAGGFQAAVGENLSYPEERICRGTVAKLEKEKFAPLSLIYLERRETE